MTALIIFAFVSLWAVARFEGALALVVYLPIWLIGVGLAGLMLL